MKYLMRKTATGCSIVSEQHITLTRREACGLGLVGAKVIKWHFSIKGISLKVMKSGFRQNEKKNTAAYRTK
eukprot:1147028-Pelagomonas_calceolata.AAC.3